MFWTACFHPHDPVVAVDIVLPVRWRGAILEEVDLELDSLRTVDGQVVIRDPAAFAQVVTQWRLPVPSARPLNARARRSLPPLRSKLNR